MALKLLVGLGNPGPKYETTRHNAGFLVLDEIASDFRISVDTQKFQGFMGRGRVLGEDCILLKPQTFMNLSGRSVGPLAGFFKIPEENVIVLHDDIDVPKGKVKAKVGGGHGGHNGIRSLIKDWGAKNFHRLKLGVGRPQQLSDGQVHDWVLGKFTDAELLIIQQEMRDEALLRIENIFKGLTSS